MNKVCLVIKENKKEKFNPITRTVKVETSGRVNYERFVKTNFKGYKLVDLYPDNLDADELIDETVESIVTEIAGE
jgi:hypothetical protein